jgi:hypothetical protein
MHQMHISTDQVTSVLLRPKKLEIREKKMWKLYESRKNPNTVQWNWAKSVDG